MPPGEATAASDVGRVAALAAAPPVPAIVSTTSRRASSSVEPLLGALLDQHLGRPAPGRRASSPSARWRRRSVRRRARPTSPSRPSSPRTRARQVSAASDGGGDAEDPLAQLERRGSASPGRREPGQRLRDPCQRGRRRGSRATALPRSAGSAATSSSTFGFTASTTRSAGSASSRLRLDASPPDLVCQRLRARPASGVGEQHRLGRRRGSPSAGAPARAPIPRQPCCPRPTEPDRSWAEHLTSPAAVSRRGCRRFRSAG